MGDLVGGRIYEDFYRNAIGFEEDYCIDLYQALIFMNIVENIETYSDIEVTDEMELDILEQVKNASLCHDDVNETSHEIISEMEKLFGFEMEYY